MDLRRGSIDKKISTPSGVTSLARSSHLVYVGQADGSVAVRDLRTPRTENSFKAHMESVSCIDAEGDLLVTCGLGVLMDRQYPDPLIKLYDLRTMRSFVPINFTPGASWVKFHPKFDSTLAIVSPFGHLQLYSTRNFSVLQNFQLDIPDQLIIASADISSSGRCLAFGDSGSCIQLWTSRNGPQSSNNIVNTYSRGKMSPLPLEPPPPTGNANESLLFVPYLKQLLAVSENLQAPSPLLESTLPDDIYYPSIPHEAIDPQLLEDMRIIGGFGVIPNIPGHYRRNQARILRIPPYGPAVAPHSGAKSDASIFLLDSGLGLELEEEYTTKTTKEKTQVPANFRRIPIGKFMNGLNESNFSFTNKSSFAGLENATFTTSYSNSILQAFYFIPQIRSTVQRHSCTDQYCLTCELRFLFHMMDQVGRRSGNKTCHTKNLFRACKEIHNACKYRIIDEDLLGVPIFVLACNFSRFLLQQLHEEAIRRDMSKKTVFFDLFRLLIHRASLCHQCHKATSTETNECFLKVEVSHLKAPQSFDSLLSTSFAFEIHARAYCHFCNDFKLKKIVTKVAELPNILCIAFDNSESSRPFWQLVSDDYVPNSSVPPSKPQWIPFQFRVYQDSTTRTWSVKQEYEHLSTGSNSDIYELTVVVSYITTNSDASHARTSDNLVAQICVPGHAADGKSDSTWYLFNDFHVLQIDKRDVAHIHGDWKLPCLLYYTRKSVFEASSSLETCASPISPDIFRHDPHLRNPHSIQVLPFEDFSLIGNEVAIDTEFILLKQEVYEDVDGSKKKHLVSPADLGLARVSVLATKNGQEVIIMDDYISTKCDQITDYLTQYSGIQPGDLDLRTSPRHITALKSVYLKLRYLVDQGFIFIGHGLNQDFHIANIDVPPEQVVDTVKLFHLKNQRKISLRFLASLLLGIEIQVGAHDSIEDSRTALLLYQKYKQLVRENRLEEVLHKIYEIGRTKQWKINTQDSIDITTPKQDTTETT
ncbi:PAN2-PAN3 deadenylation complex catalytic subunit Pan2-like [Schistocerca gregaria]|uniref:PAN2-PAN3 deadenylation complex catalytic subunit Pan2-like n=1 Tax=Schistocerca gregaria TaxID=7010 RepID=UPI00211ECA96|nr:PAN2-PAN3 deadenylation complex catalytic subunit Pan2-like [Schistocerca gregaria]